MRAVLAPERAKVNAAIGRPQGVAYIRWAEREPVVDAAFLVAEIAVALTLAPQPRQVKTLGDRSLDAVGHELLHVASAARMRMAGNAANARHAQLGASPAIGEGEQPDDGADATAFAQGKVPTHLLFPAPVQGRQNGLKIPGRRFAKSEVEDVEGLLKVCGAQPTDRGGHDA